MNPTHNKIIVSCDLSQKDEAIVGGVVMKMATKFDNNYRERSPVICSVVKGNQFVQEGEILLCHHNLFYEPSPHYLYDNLYSIPFGPVVFAKVYSDGSLQPICGNILCERVDIPSEIPLPISQRKKYIDRVIVTNGGWTTYPQGQLLFTRQYSYYEIVYNFGGEERRIHKCHADMVVGYAKS